MCYNKFAHKSNTKKSYMDRLNYTLKSEEIQELKGKINRIYQRICTQIRKNNILKRKRVVVKYTVLAKATILYITQNLSYQRLADVMAMKYNVCMSDTAWKKQLKKAIPIFYTVVMQFLNTEKESESDEKILGYSSVYAIDATDITLQGGKGSFLRVNTKYRISGKPKFEAVINDIHTGESTKLFAIESKSLYIADRAYGKTPQMEYLLSNGADFVFRISPSQVCLYSDRECKTKLELKEYLTSPDVLLSLNCFFKAGGNVYPLRIIASPLPTRERNRAVDKVTKQALKKHHKIQSSTILYAGWLFIASSLLSSIKEEDIISSYRKRWQIELHFKRSKSLLRFHSLRRCGIEYAYNMVMAWVAVSALVYSLFAVCYNFFSFEISHFNLFSDLISLIS